MAHLPRIVSSSSFQCLGGFWGTTTNCEEQYSEDGGQVRTQFALKPGNLSSQLSGRLATLTWGMLMYCVG